MNLRFSILLSSVLFAACPQVTVEKCSATTCPSGCCDAAGECRPSTQQTCGLNGLSCATCYNEQICSSGVCVAAPTGGGSGGGGATGGGGGAVTGGGGGAVTGGGGGAVTGGGGGTVTGGGGGAVTGGGGGSVTGGGGGAVTGGGGGAVTGGGGGSVTGGGGGATGGGGGTTCTNCFGCCQQGVCLTAISTAACGSNGQACMACDTARADNCDTGGCRCGANAPCGAGLHCVNSQCICDSTVCSGCCTTGNTCVLTTSPSQCGISGSACQTCDTRVANNCGNGACRCGTGAACGAGQRCFNSQCVCDSSSCNGCCTGAGTCLTGGDLTQCGVGGTACSACDPTRADNCASTGCRCGSSPQCGVGILCQSGACGGVHTWTQITATGMPGARSDHAMTYDSARQRVVMFGGETGTNLVVGDTWEYNGATSTWTQRATTGPSARRNPLLVYDPSRAVTVLFGGANGSGTMNSETWEWNGTSWTQRTPTTSPSARELMGSTWDPVRQRVVLFGGIGTSSLNDVWEYDGTTWTQRTGLGTAPSARSAMGFAFDVSRSRYVMASGNPPGSTADTWELVTTWSQVSTSPSIVGRQQTAFAFDAAIGRVVMVGGRDSNSNTLASSVEFTGTSWVTSGSTPTSRAWTRMAYDSTRSKLVLFGGYAGAYLSDTWEY